MVLLGDEDLAEHGLVCLEIVLILMQDWCMVCTEHTIGIEIILDALMGLLVDEAQVQARFGLFGDSATLVQNWCTVCVERTVGSEIVLEASDGTPW
jgi:hypothetical protein